MKKLVIFAVVLGLVLPVLTLNASQIGISIQIGNEYATVNGEKVKLDSPPVIVNGRTMVPLRFISESMGAEVEWVAETKTINIIPSQPIIEDKNEEPMDDEVEETAPPEGFIKVPPNPKFGITEPFYVSKYEMKIKGVEDGEKDYKESYVAESRASGTPWIGLTQTQAKKECEALGEGFSLITNEEWMTIAHSIESNAKNWSNNETHLVGEHNAKLNVGNVCRYGNRGTGARINVGQKKPYYGEGVLPASENDMLGCFGFIEFDAGNFGAVKKPELNSDGWNQYRRTHFLSNGEVIWDFSGNVWEWTDWYVEWAKDRARIDDHFDENYLEINALNTFSLKMKAVDVQSLNPEIVDVSKYTGKNYYPQGEDKYGVKADKYTNYNLLGRFHPTNRDRAAGAAMRGSSLMHGDSTAGIYSLAMGYGTDPDHIQCKVGFRCVWRPVK